MSELKQIEVAKIGPPKWNPRKDFPAKEQVELEASITESGLLAPLLVRKDGAGFELVTGERRLRALKKLGIKLVNVQVKELTDDEAAADRVVENVQRVDMSPLEEGAAFKKLLEIHKDPQVVANKTGKPLARVNSRVKLMSLTDAGKKALTEGKLSVGAALWLCRVEDPKEQEEMLRAGLREALSERGFADMIARNVMLDLSRAPFDTKSETLTKAGACTICPFRTDNQAALFEDAAPKGKCLKGSCFSEKCKAAGKIKLEALKAEGLKVLPQKDVRVTHDGRWIGSEYVSESEDAHVPGKGWVKWGVALKGLSVEPLAAVLPDGHVIKVYLRADAEKAMKAAQALAAIKPGKAGKEQQKAEAKKEAEAKKSKAAVKVARKTVELANAAVSEGLAKAWAKAEPSKRLKVLEAAAAELTRLLGFPIQRETCARLGLQRKKGQNDFSGYEDTLLLALKEKKVEPGLLLVQLALSWGIASNSPPKVDHSQGMEEVLPALGLDVKKMVEQAKKTASAPDDNKFLKQVAAHKKAGADRKPKKKAKHG